MKLIQDTFAVKYTIIKPLFMQLRIVTLLNRNTVIGHYTSKTLQKVISTYQKLS